MTQQIDFTNKNKTPILIDDNSISSSTSLTLQGIGVQPYGQSVNQNFLSLLENFANSQPPASPVTGQFWYDTFYSLLKVFNGSDWDPVFKIIFSDTKPVTGELWFDTINEQLMIFDGVDYISIAEKYLHKTGGTVTGALTIDDLLVDQTHHFRESGSVIDFLINYHTLKLEQNAKFESADGFYKLFLNDTDGNVSIINDTTQTLSSTSSIHFISSGTDFVQSANDSILTLSSVITATVGITLNNNPIINVRTRTSGSHPARRDQLTNLSNLKGEYVLSTGDTMTGTLRLNTSGESLNLESLEFQTIDGKNVVFQQSSNVLEISNNGTQLIGFDAPNSTVDVFNKNIINLNLPLEGTDIANKQYVDGVFDQASNNLNQVIAGQCWAWVRMNIQTQTILNQFNVLGVTVDGTGLWTINFLNTIPAGYRAVVLPSAASPWPDGRGEAPNPNSNQFMNWNTVSFSQNLSSVRIARSLDRFIPYSFQGGGDDAVYRQAFRRPLVDSGSPQLNVAIFIIET